jgi:hypothetical protein
MADEEQNISALSKPQLDSNQNEPETVETQPLEANAEEVEQVVMEEANALPANDELTNEADQQYQGGDDEEEIIQEEVATETPLVESFEQPETEVIEEPTEPKANYEKLYQRFLNAIAIKEFKETSLSEAHKETIRDFLTTSEARKLVFYVDNVQKERTLCLSTSLPPLAFDEMAYFIKESSAPNDILTESNFERKVQYGKLTKNTMESLLNVMSHVYVPVFLGNKKWPDSVRKEFNNQLHKFMVSCSNYRHF